MIRQICRRLKIYKKKYKRESFRLSVKNATILRFALLNSSELHFTNENIYLNIVVN